MTEEDKRLLNNFEARLRHLIYLFEECNKENAVLKETIAQKEKEIKSLHNNNRELEVKYANLKMVRTLSLHDEDINKTKLRLSNMVREVDKCIALLNE